jgi:hypothetical protein
MTVDHEPRRRKVLEVARARMDIENPLALAALEVVVVPLMRDLVSRVLAREQDGQERTVVDQLLEISVHRRQAQRGRLGLCAGEDLGC